LAGDILVKKTIDHLASHGIKDRDAEARRMRDAFDSRYCKPLHHSNPVRGNFRECRIF